MRIRPQRRSIVTATAAMLAACCFGAPAAWPAGPRALAPRAAESVSLDRTIRDDAVVESSGLARSTYNRRLLWTHNDKGDVARLFGVSGRGATRAVVTLSDARAVDWEDMASGPEHTLWVADIGDRDKTRSFVSIYRLAEPQALEDMSLTSTRFDFTYPDGPHDAEALMVDPRGGQLFIVTKSHDGGAVYEAPRELRTDAPNPLTRVASAPANVTGASFALDGDWFVLGNYKFAYVYSGFGDAPRRIEKPTLQQSESIEVNRESDAFFVGSEGADSPVYRVPSS